MDESGSRPSSSKFPSWQPAVAFASVFVFLDLDLFLAMASQGILALPGSSALAVPAPTGTGRAKLDPRFLSMITQAKISDEIADKLGDADVDCAAIFGNIAPDKTSMYEYFKAVLDVDPVARRADFTVRARLSMLWESCSDRADVEARAASERAVAQLPPQLSLGDLELPVVP